MSDSGSDVTPTYDVALSFAGEDRPYVEQVAEALRSHGVSFFYDAYEQSELWGKNLYTHLDQVYRVLSRYCVLFISAHYARKLWTNHELRSAQARAFTARREYILPVRFDGTEIPAIQEAVAYLDARTLEPRDVVDAILAKLGADKPNSARSRTPPGGKSRSSSPRTARRSTKPPESGPYPSFIRGRHLDLSTKMLKKVMEAPPEVDQLPNVIRALLDIAKRLASYGALLRDLETAPNPETVLNVIRYVSDLELVLNHLDQWLDQSTHQSWIKLQLDIARTRTTDWTDNARVALTIYYQWLGRAGLSAPEPATQVKNRLRVGQALLRFAGAIEQAARRIRHNL